MLSNIMKSKIKMLSSLLLFGATYLLSAPVVNAVCPICTVAVVGGLGLSRYFGIDDSITGIWVGGLLVSLTFWTVDWIIKKEFKIFKNIKYRYFYSLTTIFYILITYPPLYWGGVIGHPFNTILGIDKLVFGSIVGALFFLLGVWGDKKVRKVRGHQFFKYQKVVFPVASLLIVSLVLYFWGGYLYKL